MPDNTKTQPNTDNPQDVIDQVLGSSEGRGDSDQSVMGGTQEEKIETPDKMVDESKVPTELLTPPATPISPINTPPEPTPSLEPKPAMPVADNVPLAFSGTPTPGESTPPPIETPPPQNTQVDVPVKKMVEPKKSNKKKVVGIVSGIVILLVAVVGGLFGYAYYTGEPGLIADLTPYDDVQKNQDVRTTWNKPRYIADPVKEAERDAVIAAEDARMLAEQEARDKVVNDRVAAHLAQEEINSYCETASKGEYVCTREVENVTRTEGGLAINNARVCDGSGGYTEVDLGDACSPDVEELDCADLTRQSDGETHNGAFVGCVYDSGNDIWLNAFCGEAGDTTELGANNSSWSGNPTTVVDYANDSCGRDYDVTTVIAKTTTITTTTETVTPTLACTSLIKDVAVPEIGDELTFTCAGSVVPAEATTLAYDFRYRRDLGEWFDLTTTGANTAFTIALAGEYEVQCRVCGEINNASVCDPAWIGASQ